MRAAALIGTLGLLVCPAAWGTKCVNRLLHIEGRVLIVGTNGTASPLAGATVLVFSEFDGADSATHRPTLSGPDGRYVFPMVYQTLTPDGKDCVYQPKEITVVAFKAGYIGGRLVVKNPAWRKRRDPQLPPEWQRLVWEGQFDSVAVEDIRLWRLRRLPTVRRR
jgi:hypothetical protein